MTLPAIVNYVLKHIVFNATEPVHQDNILITQFAPVNIAPINFPIAKNAIRINVLNVIKHIILTEKLVQFVRAVSFVTEQIKYMTLARMLRATEIIATIAVI